MQIIHHVTKGRRNTRTQNNKGDGDDGYGGSSGGVEVAEIIHEEQNGEEEG
jgi:hypothetical protein